MWSVVERKLSWRGRVEVKARGDGARESEVKETLWLCSLLLPSQVVCFYINGGVHVSGQGELISTLWLEGTFDPQGF